MTTRQDKGTEPQGTPDGFADDWIDPTDSEAVAAYITEHGLEAFQAKRLEQSGTVYGN